MATDPELRRQLAKQGRLWLLSLICATVGAVTVWRTDNLLTGILAFLICLVVLGLILFAYEKRRK
jgi:4-amino-4-deoxy-L-arabinose transferase-like glycosyltransferase